jgi:prepilin-type N-terminal cleavage/methylation domain-containing protein
MTRSARNDSESVRRTGLLRGVTLAELVCVVVILAILGTIAAPRLSNAWRRQRLEMTARRVMTDIQLARTQAIRDKANTIISFDIANRRYTLQGQAGNRVSSGTYTVDLRRRGDRRIQLIEADFGGSPQVTFNQFGVPTTGGTITLGDGVERQTLTVSSTTGRVSRTTSIEPPSGN